MCIRDSLKGLIDGLGIDETTKEGKVIKAMSELLGELAEAVDAIDEDVTHAYDQINDLSEELEDLEADLYEDDDTDDDDEEPEEDEMCIRDRTRMISNLCGQMREIFSDSFRAINENFGRVFTELFGGGEASLILEDESDVLSSGIGTVSYTHL